MFELPNAVFIIFFKVCEGKRRTVKFPNNCFMKKGLENERMTKKNSDNEMKRSEKERRQILNLH